MATTEERFAEIDGYIAAMDERLRTIAQQNVTLADMVLTHGENAVRLEEAVDRHDAALQRIDVILKSIADKFEVMGIYVSTALDEVQRHTNDPEAHS